MRRNGIINQMLTAGSSFFYNLFNPEEIKIDSKQDRLKLRFFAAFEGMRPGFGWDNKPSFTL